MSEATGGLEYDQLREFLAHLEKVDPNTKFIRTHEPTDAEVIKCLIVLCVFRVLALAIAARLALMPAGCSRQRRLHTHTERGSGT